ncbi:DUF5677 domain-containing protein [Silvibacterium sp.]|uniref:DUF5677 domain-containing protein n=1 Tax=Silvibacterium sp. TaxID=1964179 RepID=UPI0039E3CF73
MILKLALEGWCMELNSENIRKIEEAIAACDRELRAMPGPTDESSGKFCHIMLVLVDAAKKNYRKLREALEVDDQIEMAWACRNLLEIAIFSRYVLISPDNADAFADDRLIDGLEIGIALKKLEQDARTARLSSPGGKQAEFPNSDEPFDADQVITDFTNQLDIAGVTRRKPLSMADLAKTVGLGDEYKAVNKISSKLVHPTAWSLFTAEVGSKRFPGATEIIFMCGALYTLMVYSDFLSHIRQQGLHH